jgi:hypothetical protein
MITSSFTSKVDTRRSRAAGGSIPDPTTLKVRVHVTTAVGQGQAWMANSLTGTMTGTYHYVSSPSFYCSASTYSAALRGTPS